MGQAERLEAVLQQNRPALLLLDLRGKEGHDLLMQVKTQHPDVLIIGFGTLRSEPLREAEHAGIYAVEDVNLERRLFQALVGRALDHLHVLEDNRVLRGDSARCRSRPAPPPLDRHRVQPCGYAAAALSMRFSAL